MDGGWPPAFGIQQPDVILVGDANPIEVTRAIDEMGKAIHEVAPHQLIRRPQPARVPPAQPISTPLRGGP
jgi:hypothetical protein